MYEYTDEQLSVIIKTQEPNSAIVNLAELCLSLRKQNKMLQTKLDDAYTCSQNLAESCANLMNQKDAHIKALVEAGTIACNNYEALEDSINPREANPPYPNAWRNEYIDAFRKAVSEATK